MGGIFRLSELSEVETTIFHFATTIGVLPRMSSPTRGEPYRRRHFREISSSLGGMAVRGEGKKGQRPWRRKEVTRISLPLCTREKTVSQGGPSFSARGAFWHRGCHPPLPSFVHCEWSIDQKFYHDKNGGKTKENITLIYAIIALGITFRRPTCRPSLCNAIWKKRGYLFSLIEFTPYECNEEEQLKDG